MPVANPPPALRAPTSEELARIEQAQRSLASAARWLRLVISLPILLGVGAGAYAWVANPGLAYERVLGGLLVLVVIGCCLIVALFLTSSGRTLTWNARLSRDRASGFGIARERGDVGWGRNAYVATVAGKLLISPFFTRLAVVPGCWNHFELLPPGSYDFDLLPESGFVVSAAPIASDERNAARVALLAAFKLRESELVANREGRATGRQRWRLALSNSPLFLIAPVLAVACYLFLRGMRRPLELGGILTLLVLVLFTVVASVFVGRRLWDIIAGEVASTTGLVSFSYGESDVTGSIGGIEFTASSTQARALQSGLPYRVYYFRRSHRLLSAEPG